MGVGNWHTRFACQCGDGVLHEITFSNPWFFSDQHCSNCGALLKHSTKAVTVRWVSGSFGIFKPKRKGAWEYLNPPPAPNETEGDGNG